MTAAEVEIGADTTVMPPRVTVRHASRGVLYSGPLPPFGAALPSTTQRLPGVDFDATLRLQHAQLGEVVWTAHVRDGIEVEAADGPVRHLELAMPYAWALQMLYAGVPWAEYLDAATSIAYFDALSCLSGIVYAPGAARLHRIDPEVLDMLVAWSRTTE